jgi:hypothetical protein
MRGEDEDKSSRFQHVQLLAASETYFKRSLKKVSFEAHKAALKVFDSSSETL